LLSFIGGLVFCTVLVGLIIIKNDRIRIELENQAQSLLRVSRGALDQAQAVVTRIRETTRGLKIDSETSNYPETPEVTEYDRLWQAVERRRSSR
jgi:hypothetical protein